MSSEKPKFKAGPPPAEDASGTPVKRKRKEAAAIWYKQTKDGETYLSIKIINENGTDIWLNAFTNRHKKPTEPQKPDYIAFERDKDA